jgi:uncharacterized membrane protein YbhN (UPF0104 family)
LIGGPAGEPGAPPPAPRGERGAAGWDRLAALRRTLPLWLALAAAVLLAVGVLGDLPQVAGLLARFRWELLPAILALTVLNYLLRLVKWEYYLRLIGAPRIAPMESAGIFFGGLAMTVTPGKVGEWVKSYLLAQRHGVPFAQSAPIILAERLTDGVAMLLLALGGLLAYGYGRELIVVVALGAVAVVAVTQWRTLSLAILGRLERLPIVGPRAHHLRDFYESAHRLLRLPALTLAIGLGLISWGGECVAFYLVLVGLGVAPTSELLLQAAFVLAVSTLVGSVSLLPGGLAVAEGSIAGLLLFLGITDQPALAAAATLLIRFATLWFGVALGVVALAWISRRAPS